MCIKQNKLKKILCFQPTESLPQLTPDFTKRLEGAKFSEVGLKLSREKHLKTLNVTRVKSDVFDCVRREERPHCRSSGSVHAPAGRGQPQLSAAALSFPACLAVCVWPSLWLRRVSHISSEAGRHQHVPPDSCLLSLRSARWVCSVVKNTTLREQTRRSHV